VSALRQVLGGLLGVVLVGGAVLASTLLAFAEFGGATSAPASASVTPPPSDTPRPTEPSPAEAAPTATATRLPATATLPPSLTATLAPSRTATSLLPTDTATVAPSPSPTTVPASPTPQPTECQVSPPLGWTTYVVERGDTLYQLSLRFGTSQAELQRVNCLANPSDIEVGQRLYAPAVATQPATPAATQPPGETPTIPGNVPTITSMPVPTATPACAPQEFYDPFLNRCRLPDPTGTPSS
jgi:LysM repeat protein